MVARNGGRGGAFEAIDDAVGQVHDRRGFRPEQPRAPEPPIDLGEWDAGLDDEPIAPRGWLLGNLFCREFLSSLLGDGATGKTAVRIACALALATGRHDIVGEHVFERCRVLYLSFEDGREELRRRVRAAEIHHGVSKADTEGYLFLAAISRSDLKLAMQRRNGDVIAGKLGAAVEKAIERRGVDVVIMDPLIKTHGVQENDNNALDLVAEILSGLATKYGIAIDVPHHTRKGGSADPGNADVGRGASALKDAGRLVYTLTKMSEADAEIFAVPEADRYQYVRMDSAKVNIAPAAKSARWFKLVGVEIGNGNQAYPKGDTVQSVERWTPADLWKVVTDLIANQILDRIEMGPSPSRRYSADGRAKDRAAWPVVAEICPALTEAQCREVIKTWLLNGDRRFLQAKEYSPKGSDKERGLFVVARPGWV
jgi:hypothetical protein